MQFINSLSPLIPPETQVIFVADLFISDYVGGAELTSEAIIDSSPYNVFKLHSKDVTDLLIKQHKNKLWVFGNFSAINPQLLLLISSCCRYIVCEYDFKFCSYRSPDMHRLESKSDCNCATQPIGILVSRFFANASYVWFMSDGQKKAYTSRFPSISHNSDVLSSVFSNETLDKISEFRQTSCDKQRDKWIILGSKSWVKGFEAAVKHCVDNKLAYEIVWNMPYNKLLEKLSTSKGLCFLPEGSDTCPRLVIEARLLGCELILNDNVQHKDELWFNQVDDFVLCSVEKRIESYLRASPKRFWDKAKEIIEKPLTISGYCTTYNCVSQDYPFVECISSMLEFCDEVCVVDGGSTDRTLEVLKFLSRDKKHKLRVNVIERDWTSSQSALFDGMQKAEARDMCTGDFVWQMDVDEVVSEDDAKKIRPMCEKMLENGLDGLCLPVVEFWGCHEKVRLDVPADKWRLSRNNPLMTHGIPRELRVTDDKGNLSCIGGSDGCDMVWKDTGERVPFATFVTQEANQKRLVALEMGLIQGNEQARLAYEKWFNAQINRLPGVFHYSWVDIERKIQLYKQFWTRHWEVLNGKDYIDSSDTNMFFDKPWRDVTDEDITTRARQLETTGGHIFHTKWDGKITPHIVVTKPEPKSMLDCLH